MITYDTHVHTSYSTDSSTPPRRQLDQAVKCGLHGICLTDHMDYGFPKEQYGSPLPAGEIPFLLDVSSYIDELQNLKTHYPALRILVGMECGLQAQPDILAKNRELTADPSLDYIIGSLHLVHRQDPYHKDFWNGRDPSRCVLDYLEELYQNLSIFTDFDALGHLDYIVRYAPADFIYEPMAYREILEEILKILVHKDIALEINTSGFKSSAYPNPHPDILALYQKLGGEMVTIGSDAHTPDYLTYRFDQLPALINKTGLRQYVTFHRRRPQFHTLDPGCR